MCMAGWKRRVELKRRPTQHFAPIIWSGESACVKQTKGKQTKGKQTKADGKDRHRHLESYFFRLNVMYL